MDISVIRPDDMERLDIHEMTDLDKMMPDVDIRSQRGGEVVIELRDVEPGMYTNPSAETTVAVHVDGVQMTRSDGLIQPIRQIFPGSQLITLCHMSSIHWVKRPVIWTGRMGPL